MWKVEGGEKKREEKIIINMGKRYKAASKGIFMSLGFLIKISWRLRKKGALCAQAAGEPLSTASSIPIVQSIVFERRLNLFKQPHHETEQCERG